MSDTLFHYNIGSKDGKKGVYGKGEGLNQETQDAVVSWLLEVFQKHPHALRVYWNGCRNLISKDCDWDSYHHGPIRSHDVGPEDRSSDYVYYCDEIPPSLTPKAYDGV